jgi:acetolactate synthase small subunit
METQVKMLDIEKGIRITITADEQTTVDQIRRNKQQYYNVLRLQDNSKQQASRRYKARGS